MIVRVCDALCGAGKTVSCINMMNNNPDKKYIFITPYLDEVDRVKKNCSNRRFISPERRYENGYSKLKDIHRLLERGENIASTHALFSSYTDETKELIRKQQYTLVLDEVIDLFQPVQLDSGDIQMLIRKKVAQKEDDKIIWEDDDYTGVLFSEIMQLSKSRNLIDYDGSFFFWSLTEELFKCFDEAYVLTYMFEYQMLKYFFDISEIEYKLIGTKKKNGIFQFCPLSEMNRCVDLRDKIHIIKNERMNYVGAKNYSLSSGWFKRMEKERGRPTLTILKNNLYNVFRHLCKNSNEKMWTTYNVFRSLLRGKGYSNSFLAFNKRATNDFSNKRYLAYCVNVFMQPWVKNYLLRLGVTEVNQDMYALSVLVQWIFRSAIRNGEEIWIYIPSKRMRYLLERWIENLYEGKDLTPIRFYYKDATKMGERAYALKMGRGQKKERGGELM